MINNFVLDTEGEEESPITLSWNMRASLPYLNTDVTNIYINRPGNLEDIEKEISRIYVMFSRCILKDGSQSRAILRLQSMFIKLISLAIPLNWYEHSRIAEGKPTIEELVESCTKIVPESYEEKVLYESYFPQVKREVLKFYKILRDHSTSPRGEIIKKLISEDDPFKKKLVVVEDKIVANEFKIWLRASGGVDINLLSNLTIITQEEWAKGQLKEIYTKKSNLLNTVIIANPWKRKYVSSFYTVPGCEVNFVAYNNEIPIIKYQVQKLMFCNQDYKKKLLNSFCRLFNLDILDSNENNNCILSIFIKNINVKPVKINDLENITKNSTNVDHVFNEKILFELFSQEDDSEEPIIEESKQNYFSIKIEKLKKEDYVKSIQMTANNLGEDRTNSHIYFVPIDSCLKAKKIGDDEVSNVHPLELKQGDVWVTLRQNQRRELFDTVLDLASNTITMKWIQINVQEWRDMLKLLWLKFHQPGTYKSYTYEKILTAINQNGGSVESPLTISNWINGEVSAVRNEKNVFAVAKIIGEKQYLDRWKSIHRAMRQLWNIHIQLGKAIGKIIMEHAALLVDSGMQRSQWINLGEEIHLPIEDVLEALDLREIATVNTEEEFLVHPILIQKAIAPEDIENLIERGMINYVS